MTRDTGSGLLRGHVPTHNQRVPTGILAELHIPDWMADALCSQVDPDLFFPEKGGSTREAKAICQRCDVRTDCLEYALADQHSSYVSPFWFGIWGGLSPKERKRLTKQRRAEA